MEWTSIKIIVEILFHYPTATLTYYRTKTLSHYYTTTLSYYTISQFRGGTFLMLEVYWGCLIGGVLFGFVSLFLGEVIGHAFHGIAEAIAPDGLDFLHPMTVVGGITLFGGIGLMLTKYSSLGVVDAGLLSGAGAVIVSILIFFLYVKPMKKTESSMGYSVKELVGKVGEVTIPIPEGGYGEVLVKMGAQHIYQLAASYDNVPIDRGADVVVVEEKDGTVYVSGVEL